MTSTVTSTLPQGTTVGPVNATHTNGNVSSIASNVISPGVNESSTLTSVNNITTLAPINESPSGSSSGAIAIVVIIVILVIVVIVALVICLKRRGELRKLHHFSSRCCWVYIKERRKSSMSSHGPLNEEDDGSVDIPGRELFRIGDEDGGTDGGGEVFSIEDIDGGAEDGRMRRKPDTDDDYYYDEIFGRSAFVDERTNTSNMQLTIDEEDELGFEISKIILDANNSKI